MEAYWRAPLTLGILPNVIGVLKVWETATWTEVVSSDQAGSAILALDWSPDGAYLASGDASGIIEMWNTAEWVYRSYLPAASAPEGAARFAWSSDGSRLAAIDGDASLVRIWNPTSRTVLLTLDCGEKSLLSDITWQPTGEHLAGTCYTLDGHFVRIWDTESGSFIDQDSFIEILDRIDWSPQGDMLLYSSRSQTVPHVNEAFKVSKRGDS
ncbi:MAG TPA: hypothetical protein VHP83_17790 [Aggregatilineaceae bacterium]|nr:hypothetical protein [Aggregatilineaceae bacterium]